MGVTRITDRQGDQVNISSDGSMMTIVRGIVKESWSGSANVTKTFPEPMRSIVMVNDGETEVTVTINGIELTVMPNEGIDEMFGSFTDVSVVAAGPYRSYVRG